MKCFLSSSSSSSRPRCSTTTRTLRILVAIRFLSSTTTTTHGMTTTAKANNNNNNSRKVAIIGGGIAGLSCAQRLSMSHPNQNPGGGGAYDVTVYDTGRLRPGGRCSSRRAGDAPKSNENNDEEFPLLSQYSFDHAAQLISLPTTTATATSDNNDDNHDKNKNDRFRDFQQQLQTWLDQGIVKEFPKNSVCTITNNGVEPILGGSRFFHGIDGMGGLPMAMKQQICDDASSFSFSLEQDVWVSPSSGVKYQKESGKWKLQANGKILGYYDTLLLAHNGKCADRIMSKTPAKDLHKLLRVNFAPTVASHGGHKMTLNSLYSWTICVPTTTKNKSTLSQALPDSFVSGFVQNHPHLRMITCQTRKYNDNDDEDEDDSNNNQHEVWTILSSAKFAKKHKAPQEFLPKETIDRVTELLGEAVQESLGLKEDLEILDQRLQLWGAAVPLNVWENGCGYIYDDKYNVGVCGDWLVEPSIAGAWTSGKLLADRLLEDLSDEQKTSKSSSTGLEGSFERSESAMKLGIASLGDTR